LLGIPPNTQTTVIENPAAGQPGFRETAEYLALCKDLRARM